MQYVNPSTPAERVARELQSWRGHFLSPAARKADRQATFEAVVRSVILAVTNYDDEETGSILARFYPQFR